MKIYHHLLGVILIILTYIEKGCSYLSKILLPINKSRNINLKRNNGLLKPVFNKKSTKLYLDVFGLGPTEVLLIGITGFVLFGSKLNKKDIKAKKFNSSEPWRIQLYEDIEKMKISAEKLRTKRALNRINQAIADENEYVLDKLAEYDDLKT